MSFSRADIRGVVGIVPTPATSDAGSWRAEDTVNTAETEKMIEAVIGAGIEFVMSTGTFGECASLTHDEWLTFTTCIAKVVRGRAPFFAGVTTLNTRDTIFLGRQAIQAGADGLFVGRPMWLPLDDDAIVRFYSDLTEALPGVPVVVYDNPAAFKGKISVEAYQRLAELPDIVATKHAGGPTLERDIEAVGDKVAVLPLDSDWYAAARRFPGLATACWSGNVACAPAPLVALSRAVLLRDWDAASAISEKVNWALKPQFGDDMSRFMDYSIPVGRARFRAAGLIDPGPSRPPYTDAPADMIAGGEETGRRWAQLEREYHSDR
ncbi:dihydrodipicolinate synthase family protein [Mycobacterium sp. CVI_P3]|uniref:Dihydrodipicolinate synthase family protein n=1 Tax=Mycobacterium pinniadriaticum TaxID=2994102 RepID=A0ABT3SKT1_9MYCO|nr:dihydrodipicolinate synthase family protein [Mycobacterium pinniadriaticum]MCX2933709.1 dihydrodipicolinate synthase family protein [Mycobacterium pinniadriaticum]MCX2940131.1 dihydrodipicolinate synthase family protein [Mycobacterium pinniadriaticum]